MQDASISLFCVTAAKQFASTWVKNLAVLSYFCFHSHFFKETEKWEKLFYFTHILTILRDPQSMFRSNLLSDIVLPHKNTFNISYSEVQLWFI